MDEPKFGRMFKVLFVGDSKAGKTTFLMRYCDSTFTSRFVPTVGIDFKVKILDRYIYDEKIKLQLWDTAGQECYLRITTAYFLGAKGFVLMFDLTSQDSFQSVRKWMTLISDLTSNNPKVILVGNKSDLTESRVITKEQGMDLAQSLGIEYFETSVKDDTKVTEAVDKLVTLICSATTKPTEVPITTMFRPPENSSMQLLDYDRQMAELRKRRKSKEIFHQGTIVFVGCACAILFCAYYFK